MLDKDVLFPSQLEESGEQCTVVFVKPLPPPTDTYKPPLARSVKINAKTTIHCSPGSSMSSLLWRLMPLLNHIWPVEESVLIYFEDLFFTGKILLQKLLYLNIDIQKLSSNISLSRSSAIFLFLMSYIYGPCRQQFPTAQKLLYYVVLPLFTMIILFNIHFKLRHSKNWFLN